MERLPASLGELERDWPVRLAEILKEIRSPADATDVIDGIRQDEAFTNLVRGWENMPTAAQANAWEMIQARLWEEARSTRPYCVRCGECCRRGSPVLFPQDLPILASGAIRRGDLVTLRRGERAYSNRRQALLVLEREQLKLREVPGTRTCIYLGPLGDACLIYENRPFQCRVLECWDPSRFDTLQGLPPLTRMDLVGRDDQLGPLLERHEERAGVAVLAEALGQAAAGDAAGLDKALEAVLFDLHVREFGMKELGIPRDDLVFFFGRPLALLCPGFGYELREDASGRPGLVPVEASGPKP